jgi:tRNA-2-methylthio-N6-dimethylallyladenosine synthase
MPLQKRGTRYHVITYGCQMNDADSQAIEAMLAARGWERVPSEAEADVVVVNTCTVRQSAEQRALGRISQLQRLKQQRPEMIVCVCGCLAQQQGQELLRRAPYVDLVVGTRDLARLPQLLEEVDSTGKKLVATESLERPIHFEAPLPRPAKLKALITIMYGCNNFCSYCIVPYVRGREISRPTEEIVAEIRDRVAGGCKEVLLLGQNVNSYRYEGIDFPDLLAKVSEIQGLARIRYITSHPKDASLKLIDRVAELPAVCENFHLPAQAGSSRVLQRMNRHYTREDYLRLVQEIRRRIPHAVITTDLMVGFPEETEDDFNDTMDLVEQVRWDAAFMFMYTPRPGTRAAEWRDSVPMELKKERLARLIQRQEEISLVRNQALIGHVEEVLVEGYSKRSRTHMMGRSRGDKVVILPGDEQLIGRIESVRITAASAHTLFGEMVGG